MVIRPSAAPLLLRPHYPAGEVVNNATRKKRNRQPPLAIALDLGNEIRRADVESNSPRQRHAVLGENRNLLRQQSSNQTRYGQCGTGSERRLSTLPRREEEA